MVVEHSSSVLRLPGEVRVLASSVTKAMAAAAAAQGVAGLAHRALVQGQSSELVPIAWWASAGMGSLKMDC